MFKKKRGDVYYIISGTTMNIYYDYYITPHFAVIFFPSRTLVDIFFS